MTITFLKKQLLLILFLLGSIAFFSCKNQPTEAVIDETGIEEIPNLSDTHFEEALLAYKDKKNKSAANHIESGIAALKQEIIFSDSSNIDQSKLDKVLAELQQLATDVKANKVRDANRLREVFANAALLVYHDYLIMEDIYIIDNPIRPSPNKWSKAFDKTERAFGAIKKNITEEAKKAGIAIEEESELLKMRRKELNEELKAHVKKMREYVKSHHPGQENNFPYYEF